jgi:hypothetical protein
MENKNCKLYVYKKESEWKYIFFNDKYKNIIEIFEKDFPTKQSYDFNAKDYDVIYEEVRDIIYQLNKKIMKEDFSLENILNKLIDNRKTKLMDELEG